MSASQSTNKYIIEEQWEQGLRPMENLPSFDEKTKQYIPPFATCIVPEDYLRALHACAEVHSRQIMPIIANEDDETLEAILNNLRGASGLTPTQKAVFLGWTCAGLFDWYKSTRVPDEASSWCSEEGQEHFATFTILVVNQVCSDREEPCIHTTMDAPDQHDDLSHVWSAEAKGEQQFALAKAGDQSNDDQSHHRAKPLHATGNADSDIH